MLSCTRGGKYVCTYPRERVDATKRGTAKPKLVGSEKAADWAASGRTKKQTNNNNKIQMFQKASRRVVGQNAELRHTDGQTKHKAINQSPCRPCMRSCPTSPCLVSQRFPKHQQQVFTCLLPHIIIIRLEDWRVPEFHRTRCFTLVSQICNTYLSGRFSAPKTLLLCLPPISPPTSLVNRANEGH